jgi:hypothetical protein
MIHKRLSWTPSGAGYRSTITLDFSADTTYRVHLDRTAYGDFELSPDQLRVNNLNYAGKPSISIGGRTLVVPARNDYYYNIPDGILYIDITGTSGDSPTLEIYAVGSVKIGTIRGS